MLQGHVTTACFSNKNLLSSAHWADTQQNRVARTCIRDKHTHENVAGTRPEGYVLGTCPLVRTVTFIIWGIFCPPHSVPWSSTKLNSVWDVTGQNILKLVLHNYKSNCSHEATTYAWVVKYATFSCVCTCCDFVLTTCPRYTSLLHVPATCCLSVHLTSFLSREHGPARWPLVYDHL